MHTVSSAFAEFDTKLNLDKSERDRAQVRHREVSEVLEGAGQVQGTFLQGSFARKTMLKPLKDVDVVVLLRPDLDLEGADGPSRAMNLFRDCIGAHWPTAVFDAGEEPAAKALRIEFEDLEFTFDLVPAFDGHGDWVSIGDRFERHWEKSNTRIQRNLVAARNQATGGRFVHQVRMLKSFVRHLPEDQFHFLKGIAVESIAFATIRGRMSHGEAISECLNNGAVLLRGPVMEPAGDDDVSAKWTPDERSAAVAAFAAGARRAAEATELQRYGDEPAAIDVWRTLLGEDFPGMPSQDINTLMKAWSSGSVTSTGRPSRTTAGVLLAAPGRAWRRS